MRRVMPALACLLAMAPSLAAAAEKEGSIPEQRLNFSERANTPKLDANDFVTLDPFVVPMVDAAKPGDQYTLIIALALTDEDQRDAVLHLRPKLRDEMYRRLYRMISFRTREPRVPPEATISRELLKVAQRISGSERVSGLVILQAFASRP